MSATGKNQKELLLRWGSVVSVHLRKIKIGQTRITNTHAVEQFGHPLNPQ